ncbi:hypothetical protein BDQ12DRAFT_674085 [Crucibulum laeve]|uniref:Uncharacterized protein n=1 Tax=Crucibulum laeve TaxID=68775 RepID=A0A5C3MI48_9AGAR|nr:hypothetical protein BDQ12DRAFT_674085 [Crucibulum laeve]
MCKWRQVRDIYVRCGHTYALPDELIPCVDRFCKFSETHPRDCGPNCRTTCWQYRQFPEQYDRTLDRQCPSCQQNRGGGR